VAAVPPQRRHPHLRCDGDCPLIAYRLDRSFAWNAAHPPKLPARPRKLRADAGARLFDRRVESLLGIAAGPLPNSRWIEAYARLGYGVLTYKTVRTSARAAFTHPNLVHCRLGDPSVAEPAPRKLDPGAVTWAVSVGLPSADPAEWRSDVTRARAKLHPDQILIVSVVGTPVPDGDPEQLAGDYALAARWAAEAGADVVEVHLSSPNTAGEHAQMIFENPALSALIVDRVRRAVGQRPIIAKIGATRSPRALHELASRLAPRLDGFVLVNGLERRVVKPDESAAFAGETRATAGVVGAAVFEHALMQVDELVAWRKAGAWNRTILAVGGITTTARARAALAAGADGVMVATAALTDPLIGARFLLERPTE
jgi:dihydroorotate dehydrogenase (NAD+) catalytic subunit